MGGIINVVVKYKNVQHVLSLHTHYLIDFVINDKFIECNEKHINKLIRTKSKPFSFSPDGYGLDLFDFDAKCIYTMQQYCSYKSRTYASIYLDNVNREKSDLNYLLWNKKYLGLLFLHSINDYHIPEKNKIFTVVDMDFLTAMKSIKKDNDKSWTAPDRFIEFKILWENAGWTVYHYPSIFSGVISFLNDLIKAGYYLSEEDILGWHSAALKCPIELKDID